MPLNKFHQSSIYQEFRGQLKLKSPKMSNARRRQNEILRNGILYLTCATGNKVPIKKTEFIKRVFETDKSIKTVQTLLNKMKRVLKNVSH